MSKHTRPRPSKLAAGRTAANPPKHRRIGAIAATVAGLAMLLLVGVVVVTSNSGHDAPRPASAAGAADTATKDIKLEMLDGSTANLADYQGQPVVVNFFASWCAPCLAEMPGFEQVHQDLHGQVAFLGVNLQDRPADGRRIVEQTGVTYDIARDPDGSLFQTFDAVAMPTTVFLDAEGRIVDVHSGEISAGALADRIDDLLLS